MNYLLGFVNEQLSEEVRQVNEELNLTYIRNIWTEHDAFILNNEKNKERLLDIIRK